MSKVYFRVKKDNFMWEEGAILEKNGTIGTSGGYEAVEDIWEVVPLKGEYISSNIIENSPEWFERVYPDNLDKLIFKTKDELKKLFGNFKK
jgi:hypothetical protein